MLNVRAIRSFHREIRAFHPRILRRAEAPETYASLAAVTLMLLIDAISSPPSLPRGARRTLLGHHESYFHSFSFQIRPNAS